MSFFLSLLYYLVIFLFTLALYFILSKKEATLKKIIFICTGLTGAGVMTLILWEHRLPLYGAFEATFYIIFILCLLEILFWKNKIKGLRPVQTCGATVIISLCLLLYHTTQPKTFNSDFFMYGNPWVNIFFNLRLMAGALFTRSALLYLAGIMNEHQKNKEQIFFSSARRMLLTGLAIFLCSEWAGSWWCLNWLGDSWQWSKGFFKAAIIFLLVMFTCHLPPSLSRNSRVKALTGSLPALFLLWVIFYH